MILLVAILHFLYLLSPATATNYTCFNATDGGFNGVLYTAVRDYIDQDCANNDIRYDQIARKVTKMTYRRNHLISTCHLWLFNW